MHDSLAERYAVRRPLLVQAAASITSGLRDTIANAGLRCDCEVHALDSEQFLAQSLNCGHQLGDALTEFEGQIVCSISVESMDHMQPLAALLGDELTAISSGWVGAPESVSQSMRIVCLVPEWAYPDGWSTRRDVPRVFSVLIDVRPQLRIAPRMVEREHDRQPRALIMKGGGVKGLAYVGALEVLADEYDFQWFIGTSAGAIAAVLLAAGYTPDELKTILKGKNFRDFFDAPRYKRWWNLLVHHGKHPADSFTKWLDDLLARKLNSHDRVRLSDLPYRATVYASRRDKAALMFDSEKRDADAAYAVRCSMSIPIVFIPQSDQGIRTFDGGIQNNFPVEALLREFPDAPFISLFLGPEIYAPTKQTWVIKDLISIWTEASDAETVRRYRDRTVIIDPSPVGTLDFHLTEDEKEFLLAAGRAAALAHLAPESAAHEKAAGARDKLKSVLINTRAKKHGRRRLVRLAIALIAVGGAMLWWLFH